MRNIFRVFNYSPWDDLGNDSSPFNKKNVFEFGGNNFDFNAKTVLAIIVAIVLLWLGSGVYKVQEGEEGVVLRFGQYTRKAMPGLNYHLPSPIEKAFIEKVNRSRRTEIGYRSTSGRGFVKDSVTSVTAESMMLTGDENIVDLSCDVTWHISDLNHYIFNIEYPESTVKAVAQSALRDVIGNTPIQDVLSDKKQEISEKIEILAQSILDSYQAGVKIEIVQLLHAEPPSPVIDSYRDVQAAKADKDRMINQAEAYSNEILPRARGKAAKMLQGAEGYQKEVVARSKGDVSRFSALYSEYRTNKKVMRDRLYLNAVEKILKDTNKTIMSGNGGVLPHMALKLKEMEGK